ncbi:MAG: hypothetical protein RR036_00900 [Oscillospiraceae bacterium]
MKRITTILKSGETKCYEFNTIPFSDDELNRQLQLYYGNLNCQRCQNAILQNGFARLLIEVEEEVVSEKTLALYPILYGYKNITIS